MRSCPTLKAENNARMCIVLYCNKIIVCLKNWACDCVFVNTNIVSLVSANTRSKAKSWPSKLTSISVVIRTSNMSNYVIAKFVPSSTIVINRLECLACDTYAYNRLSLKRHKSIWTEQRCKFVSCYLYNATHMPILFKCKSVHYKIDFEERYWKKVTEKSIPRP